MFTSSLVYTFGMHISIMVSSECALPFAGGNIHFKKSINYSMYVHLGFKECIAAITSMIYFATCGKEKDTELDDFIT